MVAGIIAACVVAGGICLWLSGYYWSQVGVSADHGRGEGTAVREENQRLRAEVAALEQQLREAQEAAAGGAGGQGADAAVLEKKEAEIARLQSEVTRLEGEKDRLAVELDTLSEELDALKQKKLAKPGALPKPVVTRPVMPESEAIDEMQAQLDMERVAHRKTKEELTQVKKELEQVKKIAAARMATSAPSMGAAVGGGRSKTMAFGMRGGGGTTGEVLRHALEKVQAEKEKLEAELEQAKRELQAMKGGRR